jgi:hypothetical protein
MKPPLPGLVEGDVEIEKDAPGYLAHGDLHDRALKAQKRRKHGYERVRVGGIEQDLEDRVEGHKPGGVFGVAAARSFQTITMAMQRARPIRMRPTR